LAVSDNALLLLLLPPLPSPTHPVFVLGQTLVVSTDSHQKHESIHILEAMDPLLPF
jgi:hypothetical protein